MVLPPLVPDPVESLDVPPPASDPVVPPPVFEPVLPPVALLVLLVWVVEVDPP